eukprot:gene36326-48928_t
MPIFWTPTELNYLEGSYLREQIDERNMAIESDYSTICKIRPDFSEIATIHEFKWARMCVCSRNFGLVINGLQTAALGIPATVNIHSLTAASNVISSYSLGRRVVVSHGSELDVGICALCGHVEPLPPQGDEVAVALQNISCGAQVYDSYGRKCNHRFLLNYGFSVENNIESDGFCPNEVPLLLELNKSDPLFESKCSFWRRDLSVPYRRIRVCVGDNENSKTMLAFLRIAEADKYDFDLLASCSGNNAYRSIRDAQVAVSVPNEQRAMMSLVSICDQHLSDYPTSFEADCQRLRTGNVPLFSNE